MRCETTIPEGSRLTRLLERAEEEHGFSWQIHGVPAIFSAITFDGTLPAETYDVHVESDPPGDYIFTGQYSLDELLNSSGDISVPKPIGPA